MATVLILHKSNFANTPISLPPLFEQKEIARILLAVDARITAEEQRKAALEGLFKSRPHPLMTGQVRIVRAGLVRAGSEPASTYPYGTGPDRIRRHATRPYRARPYNRAIRGALPGYNGGA